MDGYGIINFSDGINYEGEWKDGTRHGEGTFTSSDGRKWVGEFKNDLWDGQGVLFKANGDIQSGTYAGGEQQDEWTGDAVSNYLKNKPNGTFLVHECTKYAPFGQARKFRAFPVHVPLH